MSRASPKKRWKGSAPSRPLVRKARSCGRFEEVNERKPAQPGALVACTAVANPVVQLTGAAGLATVLAFALGQVVARGVTVDDFVGYIAAMLLVMAPLKRAGQRRRTAGGRHRGGAGHLRRAG